MSVDNSIYERTQVNLRIDSICLALVTVEPDDRELGLDLARVDLHNPNAGVYELLAKGLVEAADSRLGRAVDATTDIGLAASNAANVDDVTSTAVGSLEIDGQDSLGHVDETCHVGGKHDIDVFLGDLRSACDALDKTTISRGKRIILASCSSY